MAFASCLGSDAVDLVSRRSRRPVRLWEPITGCPQAAVANAYGALPLASRKAFWLSQAAHTSQASQASFRDADDSHPVISAPHRSALDASPTKMPCATCPRYLPLLDMFCSCDCQEGCMATVISLTESVHVGAHGELLLLADILLSVLRSVLVILTTQMAATPCITGNLSALPCWPCST